MGVPYGGAAFGSLEKYLLPEYSMDYDDNDDHDQNLHLVEEGSTKVSPVLHPYALPKFDFDDSLQGHLRFDSLVENEVFLGITSQEDNQWIEEYSRGTSAIQFSSSAVESRRKNVWSEATSSESVEMLLKSVGQEERVVEETVEEELVACDRPGSLTNGMDPNLKQCDGTNDNINAYNTIVPDEFQVNFFGSKVSSDCEQSHATFTSHSHGTPHSGGELDSVVIGDKYSLSVGEEKVDKICDDVNQEANNLAEESFVNDLQEDSSVSKIDCGNAGFSQDVDASVEECQENPQETPERCFEDFSGLSKDLYSNEPENITKSKEDSMDSPIHSVTIVETCKYSMEEVTVVSNVGSLENPSVEERIPVDEKSACSLPIGSCDMQISEGANAHVYSAEHSKGMICSKIDQELNDNMHGVSLAVSPNGERVTMQAVKEANTLSDIANSSKSDVDSLSSLSHVQSHSFNEAIIGVVSDGQQVTAGASMVSLGNSQLELYEGYGIDDVGKTSIAAGSSAELPAEGISKKDETTGNSALKGCTGGSIDDDRSLPAKISGLVQSGDEIQSSESNALSVEQDVTFDKHGDTGLSLDFRDTYMDVVGALDGQKNVEPSFPAEDISEKDETAGSSAPKVQTGDSVDEDRSLPAKISGLVQLGDASEPDAISMEQDVTFNKQGDARLPSDLRDTDTVGALDSQKDVEPFLPAEGCEGVIATAHGSESNMVVLTDAVASVESSKTSSPDALDNVQLLSQTVTTADMVTDDQPKSPILGLSLMHDNNEETAVGLSSEGNAQQGIQKVDVVVVEKDAVSVGAEKVDVTLECALDVPLPVVEKVEHGLDGHCDSPVGNCNASPSGQTTEDNPGGLKIPHDSSVEGGKDLLDPKESMTGDGVKPLNLTVNNSDEQQASVDVASPSEHDANMVHNQGGSTYVDKPQLFSFTDTKSIELSQSAKDKHEVNKDSSYENASLLKVSNDRERLQQVSSGSATKEENSFTFEVSASAGPGQTGIQNLGLAKSMNMSPVSSSGMLLDPKKMHEDSLVSPQTSSSAAIEAGAKVNSEHKPRRKSGRKESVKKGNSLKETTPRRRPGRVEKSPALLSTTTAHVAPVEGLKRNESVECSNSNPKDIPLTPTSNQPDLNNSTSIFQPSFTDNQQVQLRAQILVYGSLIAGAPPEEPHMMAAFGQSDGGRKVWDAAWRACLERARDGKFQANNLDTPKQSRSDIGTRDPDQGKTGSTQSNVFSPLTVGPSNMCIPSPVVSPMIPISSPLWNISTPYERLQSSAMPRSALLDYRQTLSPLPPHQTPPLQNFAGHSPSWLSQGLYPGQWVASSPITAFSARFSALPITEAVKLTTVKESDAPGGSVIPVDHSAGPSDSSGLSSLSKMKGMVSSGQSLSDSKIRKRKKVSASVAMNEVSVLNQALAASPSAPVAHLPCAPHTEAYNKITYVAQNRTNSGTAPAICSHTPTSAALLTPVSTMSKDNLGSFLPAISPASIHGHPRYSEQKTEKLVSKIEESKLQAADAAVHAAAAVGHCQVVWSQLERQRDSGLVLDDEAKLASSAVSIAAAASVAKAAAAAAKIASSVAEQARLMADEVFLSCRTESNDQSMISHANAVPNFDKGTPVSILKGADRSNHPTSIISAAREAARRRIEAASAASKHAENLDAIVKAAELAAEAVAQAGKIVAMAHPLPLRELVETGPEGYWKTPQSSNQQGSSDKQSDEAAASDKDIHGLSLKEDSRDLVKNQMIVDGISGSTTSHEHDKGTKRGRKASDLSKTVGAFPESEFGSIHTSDMDQNMPQCTSDTSKENSIKEGCLVEVCKDDNKNKSVWFAANVLTLKDGKALVSYTDIQSDEGSGKLKEWVPLEVEGAEVPRIRIAHPMTNMRFEGTKKRNRTALADYAWSSGDRVDVWVQNSWREAVVVETNKIDVTSLVVQFPAQGDTSIVKSWHVRPTLIWTDGKWIEWSSLNGCRSSEGDTPQEKRLKFGSSVVEGKGKDKSLKSVNLVESGSYQESRILSSSGQGSSFDVGKSSRDENKFETQRTVRGGLQKERPRVVFGVPKPGKKQKFMDVSKHYVADRSNKNIPPNDSVKLASHFMTPAAGPRGSKNNPKTNAKEKHDAEIKSKVLKSKKPPVPLVRTLSQKDKSKSSKPTSNDAFISGKAGKDSVGGVENMSGHQNQMELGSSSNTEDVIEGASASALTSGTQKDASTPKAISQPTDKGKGAGGDAKAAIEDVKDKSNSEAEPRRSNRRIQPTSRLLEGLQSSLAVSKMPTLSHASQRSHTKVTSKGNSKANPS